MPSDRSHAQPAPGSPARHPAPTPPRRTVMPMAVLVAAAALGLGGTGLTTARAGNGANARPASAGAPPLAVLAAASATVSWSSGYYPGWQQAGYPPQTIPWNAITHLMQFSFLTGSARDGSINTTAHSLTPALMQAAVAAAHQHNRKILISIGGAEDNNWDAACNATNRARFTVNLVSQMRQYGYDGIDLDIEQDWQSPAHPDYIACVAGIRTALDQISPRPLLTEAGDPDWQAYMLAQVFQNLDQVNLMSYGAHAATIATGLSNYTSRGIPASKLGVGIGIDSGVDGADPADCAAKTQYVAGNGFGGVMEWTVPTDAALHGGQTPCFNGIAPYVSAGSATPPPAPSPTPAASSTPVATARPVATPIQINSVPCAVTVATLTRTGKCSGAFKPTPPSSTNAGVRLGPLDDGGLAAVLAALMVVAAGIVVRTRIRRRPLGGR